LKCRKPDRRHFWASYAFSAWLLLVLCREQNAFAWPWISFASCLHNCVVKSYTYGTLKATCRSLTALASCMPCDVFSAFARLTHGLCRNISKYLKCDCDINDVYHDNYDYNSRHLLTFLVTLCGPFYYHRNSRVNLYEGVTKSFQTESITK
jgi:hypothetical protein